MIERQFMMGGASANPSIDAAMVEAATRARYAQQQQRQRYQLGALGAGLAGLALIGFALRRRRHHLPPASRIYDRILRLAHWSGIAPASSATPEESAAHLASHLPTQRQPLHAVAAAYTEERYAPSSGSAAAGIEDAWRSLRWPLLGAVFTRPWRAKNRPSSSRSNRRRF
jgi:hypothetical protein